MSGTLARLIAAALLARACSASADTIDIDLPGALARARTAAPEAIAARGRVAQADAGVHGAAVAFSANPEIEGGLGPRLTPAHPLDAELRISQALEPWRRGARRELASAERAHAEAERDAALRELELEVSLAFYDAVFAAQLVEQMTRAERFASAAADVAKRRRQAGEITDLDLDLARVAFSRARASTRSAEADRTTATGKLAVLVGATASDTLVVHGSLAPVALPRKLAAADRADVRAIDRERDVARAQLEQATAISRPELGVFVAYHREDTDSIVLAGLSVTLPVWNRAQGERAAAHARELTASAAHAAAMRVADRQLADALATYATTKRAVEELETAPLDDAEQLLEKTIDASQLAISDYLVARQELLNGRRDHLERQLALAKAALAVRYAAGGQP